MTRSQLNFIALAWGIWGTVSAAGQTPAVQQYLGGPNAPLSKDAAAWNGMDPKDRPKGKSATDGLQSLLPTGRPYSFVAYMYYKPSRSAMASLAQQAAQGQIDKMTTGAAGISASTSLLSSGVAADVLTFATEYGAVNQTSSRNISTVHGNLAGLAGLFVGNPYLGCISEAAQECTPASRVFRGVSASLSMTTSATTGNTMISGTNGATGAPATANLFANGNKMSSWSVRYDFQHKTLYDVTSTQKFVSAMKKAATSPEEKALGSSISLFFGKLPQGWQSPFLEALENAPMGQMLDALGMQLDALIDAMSKQNDNVAALLQAAETAIQNSFLQRDSILQRLQSNNFSLEFNGVHPLGQANVSNVKLVYSHQPTNAPLLLTFNAAAEWYDSLPSGIKQGRLRDLQAAAQVDRRLGTLPSLGPITLTAAFYYQWMKDNALISIPAGNTAPGTGIVLPGAASTLLAPKGNIDIGQVKLTLPIKDGTIKVPVSFTWSNRTELINESEKRGQIGLTLDFDSLFAKK